MLKAMIADMNFGSMVLLAESSALTVEPLNRWLRE